MDGKEFRSLNTAFFENLPKYKTDGTPYVYTVKEKDVTGYSSDATKNPVGIENGKVTITNTYTGGDCISINGLKKWVVPEDVNYPEKVTIGLYQNDDLFKTTVAATTTNWTYEFTELPTYAPSGEAYTYTVKEVDVPETFSS